MSQLLLNFNFDEEEENENSKIKLKNKIKVQSTGNWKQRLKRKKILIHHQEKNQVKQDQSKDKEEENKEDKPKRKDEGEEVRITKRRKLVEDNHKESKFKVISSLFSSSNIPTIKTKEKDSKILIYSPSNAGLSEVKLNSNSLKLHPQIITQLQESKNFGKIESPTSIQSIAWPMLIEEIHEINRDVIIQSETGSGKTLAYLVPIVQDLLTLSNQLPHINWNREIGTLAIILVPTRELAEQVYKVILNLLSFNSKIHNDSSNNNQASLNPRWLIPGTLHGGTNRTHEKARLRRGLPLLVCTPGRLLDHLEKTESLKLAGEKDKMNSKINFRWLVLDEADRLMDMGFEEQMSKILNILIQRESNTNKSIETRRRINLLCSATMPDQVKKLVGMSLNNPILLKSNNLKIDNEENQDKFSAPNQLTQYYVITPIKLRLVSLIALLRQIKKLNSNSNNKVLVFMSCTASVEFHFEAIGNIKPEKTKEDEKEIIYRRSKLISGVKLFKLHGNLNLETRLKSLKSFTENKEEISILFCTSLAGRGLDVPYVSHVIQYDLPTEGGINEYLHRIGRTARAGQSGQAWSFILPSESNWINWCESNQNQNQTCTKLNQMDVSKLLMNGFDSNSQKEWESKATETQLDIEKWVLENQKNQNLASVGFMSHVRAYTTHPTKEKDVFNLKNLHLGHLAKTFGLRDAPKNISLSKNNHHPQVQSKSSSKNLNSTFVAPLPNSIDEFNLG